jgi:hypothetical protein
LESEKDRAYTDNIFTRRMEETTHKEGNSRASSGQSTCQATITVYPGQIAITEIIASPEPLPKQGLREWSRRPHL